MKMKVMKSVEKQTIMKLKRLEDPQRHMKKPIVMMKILK